MKPLLFTDVECYPNFFLVNMEKENGERFSWRDGNPIHNLVKLLAHHTLVTFYGRGYDIPMLLRAVKGDTCMMLKRVSDALIVNPEGWWKADEIAGTDSSKLDQIDLFDVNPGIKTSLKVAGARLHYPFMAELPYPPDMHLSERQQNDVTVYCWHDVARTKRLFEALKPAIDLRVAMGDKYGLDLRSLSDAQMGEKIFKKRLDVFVEKRKWTDTSFFYTAPAWAKFETPAFQHALREVQSVEFSYGMEGLPERIANLHLFAGGNSFRMGIGGLHSTEANRALKSNDEYQLIDVDVASQYPTIIANQEMTLPGLGDRFSKTYKQMIRERLEAKRAGRKIESEGLKIALNGCFGKFNSHYSWLYSPENLIATTITGQLSLLLLIERATQAGIEVASANTDGVTFGCHYTVEDLRIICAKWSYETNLELEWQQYDALYSASVNAYIAVKPDGTVKRKGYLIDPWSEGDVRGMLMHNPAMTVCSNAVVAHLTKGEDIATHICECDDWRQFVTVRTVKGGGEWRGQDVGKVVRYVWGRNGEPIYYKKPHHKTGRKPKVANSDGAVPLLDGKINWGGIDYAKYIERAYEIKKEIGA